MDKFKFRAPSTSAASMAAVRQPVAAKKGVAEAAEDLWMDDIDEQTLLQASQIVELDDPTKVFVNFLSTT